MSMTRKSAEVSLEDHLHFSLPVKTVEVDGRYIVLSPNSANWLCTSQEELSYLRMLTSGMTIGGALKEAELLGQEDVFKSLIGQIFARSFAGTAEPPRLEIEELLSSAYFYLTNACNLACPHCYMFSGKAERNELSLPEWCRVIDEFSSLGGKNVTFSGGEVLAKKNWLAILQHAFNRGLSITVLTNGTMWGTDDVISAAPLLSEIQISIDGPNEEINSFIRGDEAFDIALATAKEFARLGVRTSIAMTPAKEKLAEYEKYFYLFFEKHIKGSPIHLRISHKLLRGREVGDVPTEEAEEYERIAANLANLAYPDHAARAFSIGHAPNQGMNNCGLGGLTVSASGEIYPCNRIGDLSPYGNIRNTSIEEVVEKLHSINNVTSVDNVEPCKTCDLKYICGGGCRLDNYSIIREDGSYSSFNRLDRDLKSRFVQKKCNSNYKLNLLRKMVSAHRYKYG